jgi:hypothetical protein
VSDGSTLVTMTLLPQPGQANKLVAFDLASGRRRWAVSLDGARIYMPIAVQGGNVLVAAGTDAGRGKLSLMRVAVATGKLVDTTQPNQQDPNVNGPNFGPFVQFVGGDDRAFGVFVRPLSNTPILGPAVFSFSR